MEYRNLGSSELKVSEVSLGGDTFGRDIDEQTTTAIINHALDSGINYIDTADAYGWGRRIRTFTDGFRVRCPTVRLFPSA